MFYKEIVMMTMIVYIHAYSLSLEQSTTDDVGREGRKNDAGSYFLLRIYAF